MTAENFRRAIADTGLIPPKQIIADGCIHAFPTNGKSYDDAGRYCFFDSERPGGWFMDWRTGQYGTWADHTRNTTDEDWDRYKNQLAKLSQKRKEENQRQLLAGIEKSNQIYEQCQPANAQTVPPERPSPGWIAESHSGC